MSTTFQTLQDLVYNNLGVDSTDPVAKLIVPAALNYASIVVGLLFKPSELEGKSDIVITTGSDNTSLASLNFAKIERVYDYTDSCEMYFVPFNMFKATVPTLTFLRFYTTYGQTMFTNIIAPVNTTFNIYYMKFASVMSAANDPLGYINYDGYVIAAASSICFAAKEEGDSADIWSAVSAALGTPFLQSAQMKEMIAGKQSLLESSIAQALSKKSGTATGGTPVS